ncbi:hypothetical protein niasHT_020092 [Heterodera trifolii]|uniref:Uncharacterized protein n=1 Tax=Heterodera trifolii TaxID=157864 RepID=A0ABD2LM73_9BILA
MATLLSFLANTMNIDVDRFGLAVTTSMSRWNEAQAIVEGLHARGYELKTQHLYPRERNVRLHGSELSRSGANRLGAYNGSARGPTVSELYRSRHGITLRHPSAPCLMEPGGNGHI